MMSDSSSSDRQCLPAKLRAKGRWKDILTNEPSTAENVAHASGVTRDDDRPSASTEQSLRPLQTQNSPFHAFPDGVVAGPSPSGEGVPVLPHHPGVDRDAGDVTLSGGETHPAMAPESEQTSDIEMTVEERHQPTEDGFKVPTEPVSKSNKRKSSTPAHRPTTSDSSGVPAEKIQRLDSNRPITLPRFMRHNRPTFGLGPDAAEMYSFFSGNGRYTSEGVNMTMHREWYTGYLKGELQLVPVSGQPAAPTNTQLPSSDGSPYQRAPTPAPFQNNEGSAHQTASTSTPRPLGREFSPTERFPEHQAPMAAPFRSASTESTYRRAPTPAPFRSNSEEQWAPPPAPSGCRLTSNENSPHQRVSTQASVQMESMNIAHQRTHMSASEGNQLSPNERAPTPAPFQNNSREMSAHWRAPTPAPWGRAPPYIPSSHLRTPTSVPFRGSSAESAAHRRARVPVQQGRQFTSSESSHQQAPLRVPYRSTSQESAHQMAPPPGGPWGYGPGSLQSAQMASLQYGSAPFVQTPIYTSAPMGRARVPSSNYNCAAGQDWTPPVTSIGAYHVSHTMPVPLTTSAFASSMHAPVVNHISAMSGQLSLNHVSNASPVALQIPSTAGVHLSAPLGYPGGSSSANFVSNLNYVPTPVQGVRGPRPSYANVPSRPHYVNNGARQYPVGPCLAPASQGIPETRPLVPIYQPLFTLVRAPNAVVVQGTPVLNSATQQRLMGPVAVTNGPANVVATSTLQQFVMPDGDISAENSGLRRATGRVEPVVLRLPRTQGPVADQSAISTNQGAVRPQGAMAAASSVRRATRKPRKKCASKSTVPSSSASPDSGIDCGSQNSVQGAGRSPTPEFRSGAWYLARTQKLETVIWDIPPMPDPPPLYESVKRYVCVNELLREYQERAESRASQASARVTPTTPASQPGAAAAAVSDVEFLSMDSDSDSSDCHGQRRGQGSSGRTTPHQDVPGPSRVVSRNATSPMADESPCTSKQALERYRLEEIKAKKASEIAAASASRRPSNVVPRSSPSQTAGPIPSTSRQALERQFRAEMMTNDAAGIAAASASRGPSNVVPRSFPSQTAEPIPSTSRQALERDLLAEMMANDARIAAASASRGPSNVPRSSPSQTTEPIPSTSRQALERDLLAEMMANDAARIAAASASRGPPNVPRSSPSQTTEPMPSTSRQAFERHLLAEMNNNPAQIPASFASRPPAFTLNVTNGSALATNSGNQSLQTGAESRNFAGIIFDTNPRWLVAAPAPVSATPISNSIPYGAATRGSVPLTETRPSNLAVEHFSPRAAANAPSAAPMAHVPSSNFVQHGYTVGRHVTTLAGMPLPNVAYGTSAASAPTPWSTSQASAATPSGPSIQHRASWGGNVSRTGSLNVADVNQTVRAAPSWPTMPAPPPYDFASYHASRRDGNAFPAGARSYNIAGRYPDVRAAISRLPPATIAPAPTPFLRRDGVTGVATATRSFSQVPMMAGGSYAPQAPRPWPMPPPFALPNRVSTTQVDPASGSHLSIHPHSGFIVSTPIVPQATAPSYGAFQYGEMNVGQPVHVPPNTSSRAFPSAVSGPASQIPTPSSGSPIYSGNWTPAGQYGPAVAASGPLQHAMASRCDPRVTATARSWNTSAPRDHSNNVGAEGSFSRSYTGYSAPSGLQPAPNATPAYYTLPHPAEMNPNHAALGPQNISVRPFRVLPPRLSPITPPSTAPASGNFQFPGGQTSTAGYGAPESFRAPAYDDIGYRGGNQAAAVGYQSTMTGESNPLAHRLSLTTPPTGAPTSGSFEFPGGRTPTGHFSPERMQTTRLQSPRQQASILAQLLRSPPAPAVPLSPAEHHAFHVNTMRLSSPLREHIPVSTLQAQQTSHPPNVHRETPSMETPAHLSQKESPSRTTYKPPFPRPSLAFRQASRNPEPMEHQLQADDENSQGVRGPDGNHSFHEEPEPNSSNRHFVTGVQNRAQPSLPGTVAYTSGSASASSHSPRVDAPRGSGIEALLNAANYLDQMNVASPSDPDVTIGLASTPMAIQAFASDPLARKISSMNSNCTEDGKLRTQMAGSVDGRGICTPYEKYYKQLLEAVMPLKGGSKYHQAVKQDSRHSRLVRDLISSRSGTVFDPFDMGEEVQSPSLDESGLESKDEVRRNDRKPVPFCVPLEKEDRSLEAVQNPRGKVSEHVKQSLYDGPQVVDFCLKWRVCLLLLILALFVSKPNSLNSPGGCNLMDKRVDSDLSRPSNIKLLRTGDPRLEMEGGGCDLLDTEVLEILNPYQKNGHSLVAVILEPRPVAVEVKGIIHIIGGCERKRIVYFRHPDGNQWLKYTDGHFGRPNFSPVLPVDWERLMNACDGTGEYWPVYVYSETSYDPEEDGEDTQHAQG